MKKELEQELFNIDPEWFDRGDPRRSLMYFGFECDDGWYRLLERGMTQIKQYINRYDKAWNNDEQKINDTPYPYKFEVVQVKEKFGTLRFYVQGADNEIRRIISHMEWASGVVCEVCGRPGKVQGAHWLRCVCEECEKTRESKWQQAGEQKEK